MIVLKKIVGNNKKYWDSKIKYALWVDKITKKSATWKTPFELVYGSTVSFIIYIQLPVYQMLQEYGLEEDSITNRIKQLIELDESQRNSLDGSIRNQEKVKITFDKSAKPISFQIGCIVYYGTNEGKIQENIGSLIVSGWGHSSSTTWLEPINFFSTPWKEKSFSY